MGFASYHPGAFLFGHRLYLSTVLKTQLLASSGLKNQGGSGLKSREPQDSFCLWPGWVRLTVVASALRVGLTLRQRSGLYLSPLGFMRIT